MVVESPAACERTPKVSVLIVAYNHGPFIREAVLSALNQTASFPHEVVVGDDYSTDLTRGILEELLLQHPDRLRLVLHERNLGQMGKHNLVTTFAHCRGEYVCLMDGDDFYTDPAKLQRQADFLDQHPQCPACFHDFWFLDPDGTRRLRTLPYPEADNLVPLRTMIGCDFPHILTIMFRRRQLVHPAWYFDVSMGDWTTWMLLAAQGPCGYLREPPMAAYRLHGHNYWIRRPLVDRSRDELAAFEKFAEFLQGQCADEIGLHVNRRQFWLAEGLRETGKISEAREILGRALRGWPRYRGVSAAWVIRYWIRLYAPGLLSFARRLRNRPA